MRKTGTYFFLFLLVAAGLQAQDPHFSQFTQQPALINPALTAIDKDMRAVLSYKSQWRSVSVPYTTYGLSFESRLPPGGWEQVDKHRSMTFKERGPGKLAAGLSVYRDKSGDGNLDLTQANLSLATFIKTGEKSLVSLGMQGSFVQRRLNTSALIFPNQYNGSGYTSSLPSNESFQSLSYLYGELGAGIVWTFKNKLALSSHDKTKATLGFSAYHLNKAEQKYLNGASSNLKQKYVYYGDFFFTLPNPRIAVAPKFLVQQQGAAFEALVGVMMQHFSFGGASKYTGIGKSSMVGYGIYYRNRDAVILNVLLEWKEQYAFGLSYDINVSRLAGTTTGRGGTEVMLRFTPPGSFLYQKKKKPEPVRNSSL